MEKKFTFTAELPVAGEYDVIVCGGGVAGIAAAISAARRGRSTLLLEKSNILGGLGTLGLVNYFVPMCNGRGKQIIFGFAEKWLREARRYGYDTVPPEWQDGEPKEPTNVRYTCRYSPWIFALQLTEMVKAEGIDLILDCQAVRPDMEGKRVRGVITESKSGLEYYDCKVLIDTTGDADLLRQAGMPTVAGQNFYSWFVKMIDLRGCRKALESGNIYHAYSTESGGDIDLYGHGQPADKPRWSGLTKEEVTDYLVTNQMALLKKLKGQDRLQRDVAMMPMMPNFRTTCRLDGDYALKETDIYRHFDDAVCAINHFDAPDALYEIPLRCLTRKDWPNLMTAGRSASGEGFGWDLLRIIPPAIMTGQAAGEAAVLSLEEHKALADVSVSTLQRRLEQADVMIHFPDSYIPADAR